ncbi:DUF2164 family protein [Jeotgalibacillus marinus]|uniref:DUF2164 family protein n=1 Tax=Jeotgalibacillus marinus TaxID=86667 RepID=A0ABV3Q4P5_9BACL
MKDPFTLSEKDKQSMVQALRSYFEEERNEEIGELAATLLLDFLLKEIGPTIYNKGVADAHSYLTEKLEDVFEIQK